MVEEEVVVNKEMTKKKKRIWKGGRREVEKGGEGWRGEGERGREEEKTQKKGIWKEEEKVIDHDHDHDYDDDVEDKESWRIIINEREKEITGDSRRENIKDRMKGN